jgi:hypothetical protein
MKIRYREYSDRQEWTRLYGALAVLTDLIRTYAHRPSPCISLARARRWHGEPWWRLFS